MDDCLFCKIAAGTIPTKVVMETDELLGFHDVHPQAPTHILVIPKRHIATINDCQTEDEGLLGSMVLAAKHIASECGINESGYRLNFNVNSGGGQEIYHIHLHVLGGRQMKWPPG
jgi:histidine triad (HIT) family protein